MKLAVQALIFVILPAAGCLHGAAIADSSEVIAEVGDHKITRAELEKKETGKLLRLRAQYYKAEREAVNQMIDDYLLEEKARQEHLTVPELIKRDVQSQLKDPTEDQLEVYYEGTSTDEPFPAVRDKILETIRQIRLTKAKVEYVAKLREQTSVMVNMTEPTEDVSIAGAPIRGARDAKVQIIEFADYQCPVCQLAHTLLKKLDQEFEGKIALVFKDMPLPMHAQAAKAAEAARCAGAQGKFWEMHDLLFDNAKRLEVTQLKEYARTLKLDSERFDKCLDSGEQTTAVKNDFAEAQRLGLIGTPSFFMNDHFFVFNGSLTYFALRGMVEQELAATAAVGSK